MGRTCRIAGAWLGVVLLTLPTHLEAGFEESYRKARQAVERGRWQAAAEHLEKSIRDQPEAGEMVRGYGVGFEPYLPYFYLGLAYYEMGDMERALALWAQSERQGAIQQAPQFKRLRKLKKKIQGTATYAPPPPPRPAVEVPSVVKRPPSGKVPLGDVPLPPGYALIVGASEYRDRASWATLPGVLNDVPEVSRVLRTHGFQVQELIDPTTVALERTIKQFLVGADPASRLLFYYAGHGYTLMNHGTQGGYLVPVDAPHPERDETGFRLKALTLSRFQEWVKESPAQHVMFLFDSCFSGNIFDQVRSGPISAAAHVKIQEKSRLFVAAGDADEEVPDQSMFRRVFVEALEGAGDIDQDGIIFGSEIGEFIIRHVTRVDPGREQTPRSGRSAGFGKGDFPFQVVRR